MANGGETMGKAYPAGQLDTQIRRATVMERLVQERRLLQGRLAELESAIAAMEANPQVMEVVEKLSRVTNL